MVKTKSPKMFEIESVRGIDLGDYLNRKYTKERLSTIDLGKELNIGDTTVSRWLDFYSVQKRGPFERTRVRPPSKLDLKQAYEVEGRSIRDIGKTYKMSEQTAGKWLDRYKIPRRGRERTHPSRDWLENQYSVLNRPSPEIAKELGVDPSTIREWLLEYNLPIKSVSESKLNPSATVFSHEELKGMLEDGKTMADIARKAKVSSPTVRKWLKEIGLYETLKHPIPSEKLKDINYIFSQAITAMQELSCEDLPSPNILDARGYYSLTNAIQKYHGGFAVFRGRLNEHLGKRSEKDQVEGLLEKYVGGEN